MSLERIIFEKLRESRRLDESWPPILNRLVNHEKNKIRKELNKLNIDIENTPANTVVITNGRDPRLKGKNVVIFETEDNSIAVWVNGMFIKDAYIFSVSKYISKMSWKDILSHSKRIISMEFDEKSAAQLKQKKAERAESQKGMVQRYTKDNKPKYARLDKSGYIVDPNKYKKMFAELNISNSTKILADAKDMYMKLASNLDKIDWESDNSFESYDYVMRNILEQFKALSQNLKTYEANQKERPDDEWSIEYYKNRVANAIKDLKDIMAKGKKYL